MTAVVTCIRERKLLRSRVGPNVLLCELRRVSRFAWLGKLC